MFRTALVAVLLTLAIGQEVSLLCHVFCEAYRSAESRCHPREQVPTSSSVATASECCPTPNAELFFSNEKERIRAFTRTSESFTYVANCTSLANATDTDPEAPGYAIRSDRLLDTRPLVTPRRI